MPQQLQSQSLKQEALKAYADAKTAQKFDMNFKEAYKYYEQAKQYLKILKKTVTGAELQDIEQLLAKIKSKQEKCKLQAS